MNRIHNFSAGPAALPLEVLEKAQKEFVDYQSTGTSIIEKSHRGAEYVEVDGKTDTIYHTIDNFEFTNQEGQKVTNSTFENNSKMSAKKKRCNKKVLPVEQL